VQKHLKNFCPWLLVEVGGFDDIDEAITGALVVDYGMMEEKALDVYFESQTYKMLIDESTNLYQKPWTEIFQMLLHELKLKK
jgi:hypothetical protein